MSEKKDFIDITPPGVLDGQGLKGLKNTVFQENEIAQIRNNPGNLTKEGIEEKIRYWNLSSNKHVQIKYATMVRMCPNIAPSGKLEDGSTIFSRDKDGNPDWVEAIDKDKKIEAKPKPVEVKAKPKPEQKTEIKGD